MMNAALVSEPAWCLVGFVICDIGSALVFFLLFSTLDFPVDADFAAAYALSKSCAPRLAFDAVVAAKMAAAPSSRRRANASHPGRGRARRVAREARHPSNLSRRRQTERRDRARDRAQASAASRARRRDI